MRRGSVNFVSFRSERGLNKVVQSTAAMREKSPRSCTLLAMAALGAMPLASVVSAATFTTSATAPVDPTIQISQTDNSKNSTSTPASINYLDYSDNYGGTGQAFTPISNFSLTSFTFEGNGNAGTYGGTLAGLWTIYVGSVNGNYYSGSITMLDTETADGTPISNDVGNGNSSNYDTVTLATPIPLTANKLYYWAIQSPTGSYYGLAGTQTGTGTYNQNSTSQEYTGGEALNLDNANSPPTDIIQLQNADRTFFVAGVVSVSSTNSQWAKDGNGSWLTAANWSNNTVPQFAGDTATLANYNNSITTNPVVTLSSGVTIDAITFGATGTGPTGGYNISNGGAGQINCGPTITVNSGIHQINVPFNLVNNYANSSVGTFTIATNSSLTIGNLIGGSYGNLTVTGGGLLVVDKFSTMNLTLNGATLTTSVGGAETGGGYDTFNNNAVLNINTLVEVKQLYDDGSDVINIGSQGSFITENNYGSNVFLTGTVAGTGTIAVGAGTEVTLSGGTDGGGLTQLTGNNSNFSGGISVTNQFVLRVGSQYTASSDSSLGNGSATNTITLDNGILAAVSNFSGTHAVIINAGGGTIDTADSSGLGGVSTNATPANIGFGAISGVGTLTVVGGGTVTIGAQVVPANTSGGIRSLALGGLTISAGEVALASPSIHSQRTLLTVGSLSLAGSVGSWTSLLDLGANDLDVQNGNLAQIVSQLKQGYNHGAWTGTGGIISSAAAADTTFLTTLGVIQNNSGLFTTFDGQPAGTSDVIVKYTYYGDANLDGRVDGSDYALIDNGFNNRLTGWINGDFNYDGVIDGSDYTLIDNAYLKQGAALNASIASPTAQIGGTSAVPEPASVSLLALAAAGVLSRRRVK